jgi:hypothetical protein
MNKTEINTLTVEIIEDILQRAAELAREDQDEDAAEHLHSSSFWYAAEESYIREAIKQLQHRG